MAIVDYPRKSLAEWAKLLDWHIPSGPAKYRVDRAIKRLTKHKLTKLSRDGHYQLTPTGRKEAKAVADRIREAAE